MIQIPHLARLPLRLRQRLPGIALPTRAPVVFSPDSNYASYIRFSRTSHGGKKEKETSVHSTRLTSPRRWNVENLRISSVRSRRTMFFPRFPSGGENHLSIGYATSTLATISVRVPSLFFAFSVVRARSALPCTRFARVSSFAA